MTLLEKFPAGCEVRVTMTATMDAPLENVDLIGDNAVWLTGGDAPVVDENGEEIGWLSTLAEVAEDE